YVWRETLGADELGRPGQQADEGFLGDVVLEPGEARVDPQHRMDLVAKRTVIVAHEESKGVVLVLWVSRLVRQNVQGVVVIRERHVASSRTRAIRASLCENLRGFGGNYSAKDKKTGGATICSQSGR